MEKNMTIFFQIFSDFEFHSWTRKNVISQVIINIDIQSLTIQENHEDPLLHNANASMMETLLWKTKIVNMSTTKIIKIKNTIKSLINLKLGLFIQKFRVINRCARNITIISLARNDITFSRGFKFL